tara:strand:- start:910 stop:1422 length:513 start_codon:yes stop_codon:yes gene_type:complete
MAIYAKVENGAVVKYPYLDMDLRSENPNTSFPANSLNNSQTRSKFGIEEVVSVDMPYKAGWNAVDKTPTLVNNSWTQTWTHELKDVNKLRDEDVTKVEMPVEEGFGFTEGTPELVGEEWMQTWDRSVLGWRENRIRAYNSVDKQLEFITENGLEAWQAKVADIKAKYPKS